MVLNNQLVYLILCSDFNCVRKGHVFSGEMSPKNKHY